MALMVTFVVTLALCTLSLSLFSIFGGYSVTIAAFVIFIYCFYAVNNLLISHLIVYGLILFFLTTNALVNVSWINEIEFIKSFLLTAFFFFVYITSFDSRARILSYLDYGKALSWSAYIICGFQMLQLTEQLYFGTTSSWFWLDGISISTANDIGRFEAVNILGFFRPTSVFHEPSYLAAVAFVMLVICDRLIPASKKLRYILISSIIFSLSSTILAILVFYLSLNILLRGRRFIYLGLPAILLLFMVSWEYMLEIFRLGEMAHEGTSGYVRLVEPLLITKSALLDNPFGIPLGQSEVVFNNSFFLFPLYFGVLTPCLAFFWIAMVCAKITCAKQIVAYVLGFLSLLLVNGAIFTMESSFLLLLLNSAFMRKGDL
jgi:hypothetical protein